MADNCSPAQNHRRRNRPWVGLLLLGCTEQRSELLTRQAAGVDGATGHGTAGAGAPATAATDVVTEALSESIIAVINERPIGGASLQGITEGGGDYDAAFAAQRIYLVDDIPGIIARVGGDEPAIVLIAEGDYAFPGVEERRTCEQACEAGAPREAETVLEGYCTNDEPTTTKRFAYDSLDVGSNKTIIGLGSGALLMNVELRLSNSSNVILRNLSITDVSPEISGFGYGLRLWPSDHVWLDHLSLSNIGDGFVQIVSDYDDNQVVTAESGYITITNSEFDGNVAGLCELRSSWVIATHRTPAVTLAMNWFHGSHNLNPYLFGPGTWGHVFNNLWTDIDNIGLAIACGAQGIAQGNVFSSTLYPMYNNDDGQGVWNFCRAGYFGLLYAPFGTGDDEDNLYDTGSLSLHEQPTDGAGIVLPMRETGHRFRVEVPVGSDTEGYDYELLASPGDVPVIVKSRAGVGKLFL